MIVCPKCGAYYSITIEDSTAKCSSCGTKFELIEVKVKSNE